MNVQFENLLDRNVWAQGALSGISDYTSALGLLINDD